MKCFHLGSKGVFTSKYLINLLFSIYTDSLNKSILNNPRERGPGYFNYGISSEPGVN